MRRCTRLRMFWAGLDRGQRGSLTPMAGAVAGLHVIGFGALIALAVSRSLMTVAPDVERTAFEDVEGAVRALRARGLRLSTSRRLILQALFASEQPVSADKLARTLQLELTSVYRNLETLERHGLVQHVHLGHGAGMYTLVGRGKREYLYCDRCGAVRAVAPDEFEPVRHLVSDLFGYETRFTHFALVGVCPKCAG